MSKLTRALAVLLFFAWSTGAIAQKAFVRDDLASDAVRLEESLRKEADPLVADKTADELRRNAARLAAIGRDDDALAEMGAAVTHEPKRGARWLDYAKAAFALRTTDASKRYTLLDRAMTAAYAAYARAGGRGEEADALALLGAVAAQREMWRPALDAYRASLDRRDDADVRTTYNDLREKHGFRILDYKVDSDAASPRICFRFSEQLQRGKVDFAPFVAVAGRSNAAVSTDDQQLCVEGLKHGERYAVVVRQGLPSTVDEALLKSADYEIYIKDRSPQVRFTGKNYVLPRIGQEGIPVVSVNTQKIDVKILRIGDRNLLGSVRSEDFLSQLGRYRTNTIADSEGVKVWNGTLDVVGAELNKDTVTAFPVLEAVGKLQPGVYAMTARAANGAPGDDEESSDTPATQWFVVSDLGLTAFSGVDGVHAVVRSLATAEPLAGVELKLVARSNEVLATQKTDAAGLARFDAGLSRGGGGLSPGLLVATDAKGDYGFLDLQQSAFDLTDRGVKGRTSPDKLDAYVFPERGVYRSGETVYVTTLLRDPKGVAVPGLPLTMVVRRPDGVEYKRTLVPDQGMGGRSLTLPLLSGAATGTWHVSAFADPKGAAIGDATFLVEDYVPERLDVTLAPTRPTLRSGEPARIAVDAKYLYGAPGANLDISGEVSVQAAPGVTIPGLEGYQIGLADEAFESVTGELKDAATTDAAGHAVVDATIPSVEAPKPVQAKIVLRVGEAGGRAVERTVTLPILPKGTSIAVKPEFGGGLSEGSLAKFAVVALTSDGKRVAKRNISWALYQVRKDYQWFRSDGRWNYEPISSSRKTADGKVDVGADDPIRIEAKVGWGSYRLDVRTDDGEGGQTSVTFDVGWSGNATAQTPDLLDLRLDQAGYKAGDTMKLRINSRFAGRTTIAIVSDKVEVFQSADLVKGENTVEIPVKAEWGAGAYAVALAHRPLDQAARRMPGRALGVAWFRIDEAARKLEVSIGGEAKVRPRGQMVVPIKLAGLAPGEEAEVTVAAVDIGILNITHYQTPSPGDFFFGQRQLPTEVRDLYGFLIDGMQGTRGAIRSGGDGSADNPGAMPTQAPLARFSGIVKVKDDGTAEVAFDLPAFNGSVRVMAVAWSKSKVGSAARDVIIRDPVVVVGTLPRFLSIGDQSRFFVEIDNVEGKPGDYAVDLDVHGPVVVAADAAHKSIRLESAGKTSLVIPVTAAGVGKAVIDLRLSGPGLEATQSFALGIETGSPQLYRRSLRRLEPGDKLTLSNDILGDFIPGTGSVSLAVSAFGAIDVPALLQALDRYPYGCSEQIVSRAMPLLYVNKLASMEQLALDGKIDDRVRDAISRVMARQDSSGAFGLWTVGSEDDLWLDAFVTDFLTRARERGFAVPQKAFDQGLDHLRNQVVNAGDIDANKSAAVAYAVYVLARNGRPVMGDLRYLADTKLDAFESPLARAQLAAALALLGDRGRAQSIFTTALDSLGKSSKSGYSRPDYGSRLRDGAATIALLAESGGGKEAIIKASDVVADAKAEIGYTSTQEQAWMVLAAQALAKESESMSLSVDGRTHTGSLYRTWRARSLDARPVEIANTSTAPVQVVVTTAGHPTVEEPAASRGYDIERSFYKLDGTKVDAVQVKQNDRLVVVLKVTEKEAKYARLLLVDLLPAGLEIDNPNLVDGGSIDGMAWLKKDVEPTHTEYRDDRFVAAFNRDAGQSAFFNVAYVVRAVAPGKYVLPPATVEDMYRPDRYGRTAFGKLEVVPAKP